jgi:hypothetical protein
MKKVIYTPPPFSPSNNVSRNTSRVITKPTRNGKGDKWRKGINLLKYRDNFDSINWKHLKFT